MTLLILGDLPAYEAQDAYDAIHDHIYWLRHPPKTHEECALADNAYVRLCQAEARLKMAIHGEIR